MKMKLLRSLLLVFIAMSALSGCGKGKREAAQAISAAKESISQAKRMRGDGNLVGAADGKLRSAERSFGKRKYANARSHALAATDYANQAISDAENRKRSATKSEKKPATQPKSRKKRIS